VIECAAVTSRPADVVGITSLPRGDVGSVVAGVDRRRRRDRQQVCQRAVSIRSWRAGFIVNALLFPTSTTR
jgi:hypothetical protein